MNDIVFYALVALVVFIGLAFTSYLLPLFKDKMNDMGLTFIVKWIDKAVRYAEQVFGGGQGAQKKAEVIKFILQIAETYKIKITEEQIDKLIEASVFAMNHEKDNE